MNCRLTGPLLALLFVSATTVSAEVIWRGDFETGDTKQWKGAPKDGVTVVKDPVREGKYALRIDGTNAARKRKHDRIPRELETICLKAMAKEPSRRYQAAGSLAEDLRRYLQGRPIHARPVGQLQRSWRWSRRNPVVAGLTTAVTLLAVVSSPW